MTVNEYIDSFEALKKERLLEIHHFILTNYPEIKFYTSYKIIGYNYLDRKFHLGAFKNHIGLYTGKTTIERLPNLSIKSKNGTYYLPYIKPFNFEEIKQILDLQLL